MLLPSTRQIYWLATYVWDMGQYLILVSIIMAIFGGYSHGATKTFVATAQTGWATFLLLWLYGLSCIPLAYLYSFLFETPYVLLPCPTSKFHLRPKHMRST